MAQRGLTARTSDGRVGADVDPAGLTATLGIGCFSTVSTLRVYHRVGAGRPIRVVWALEEVGADYELVTMSAEEGRSVEHRARHPLGRVPVLVDEQGPMFESTALVFHVAELYTDARLLPPPATHERAVVQGWSIFAMTELEAPAIESARQREANPEASAKAPRAARTRSLCSRARCRGRLRTSLAPDSVSPTSSSAGCWASLSALPRSSRRPRPPRTSSRSPRGRLGNGRRRSWAHTGLSELGHAEFATYVKSGPASAQ